MLLEQCNCGKTVQLLVATIAARELVERLYPDSHAIHEELQALEQKHGYQGFREYARMHFKSIEKKQKTKTEKPKNQYLEQVKQMTKLAS